MPRVILTCLSQIGPGVDSLLYKVFRSFAGIVRVNDGRQSILLVGKPELAWVPVRLVLVGYSVVSG